jgi:flagellar hook assembly protein FlgD
MKKLHVVLVLGLAVGVVCWAFGPSVINAIGKEAKVKVADLPDAVKATLNGFIEKEAPGAKIEKIEKQVEDGKVIYDIELEAGDKDIELEIAEDGTLLEKEVAVDDEDEGMSGKDNDEEDDDDEKGE